MKKLIAFCAACLVTLAGCTPGGAESTAPETPVPTPPSATPLSTEEVAATPSPTPLVESSAPVVLPTESLPPETTPPAPTGSGSEEPAWDGDPDTLTLDDFPTQLTTDLAAAISSLEGDSAGLYLVAQLPDADTWLYGFYGPGETQGLILRVGTEWQSLDIPFVTPAGALPAMAYGDYDGDLDLELAIVTHQGSGTGVNVWGLSVVDFSEGPWELFQFIPADYEAILDLSLTSTYDAERNVATLQAGEAVLELDLTALGYSDPGGEVAASLGGWVLFTAQEDTLSATFSIDLNAPGLPAQGLQYAALLQADVVYTGSAFGLGDFTFSQSEP